MTKDELITSLRGLADGVKDDLREAARTCAVCRGSAIVVGLPCPACEVTRRMIQRLENRP